jgi:hypothetical protein
MVTLTQLYIFNAVTTTNQKLYNLFVMLQKMSLYLLVFVLIKEKKMQMLPSLCLVVGV